MYEFLDNMVWKTLTGAHERFAVGSGGARRYAPGFSPIVGFADRENPDFASLAEHCEAGETFYTGGWSGPIPSAWDLDMESSLVNMVWDGRMAEAETVRAVELGRKEAEAALELAMLTHPGPFGLRTLELGEYYGVSDGAKLVSMAGERFWTGTFREISGVCTHPDYQGQGLAKGLMNKLIRRQLERGETPMLHVMSDNHLARGLYQRMGFRDHQEYVLRVFSKA